MYELKMSEDLLFMLSLLLTLSRAELQFKPAYHPVNQLPLCAIDPPSAVLAMDDAHVGVPPGVPEPVVCSFSCAGYFGCTSFNYRSDLQQCELFNYAMKNCTASAKGTCMHFQVCT